MFLRLSNDDFDISKISVYPNPASDILNISLGKNIDNIRSITLYDLNGKLITQVNEDDNEHNAKLNVSSLNSGIYVLKVETDNNQYNQKVIIE